MQFGEEYFREELDRLLEDCKIGDREHVPDNSQVSFFQERENHHVQTVKTLNDEFKGFIDLNSLQKTQVVLAYASGYLHATNAPNLLHVCIYIQISNLVFGDSVQHLLPVEIYKRSSKL